MYFKDDFGNPIFANGDKNRPFYDHTQPFVRTWWARTVTSVMQAALGNGTVINGIFGDGVAHQWNDVNVSAQRQQAYNEGILSLLDETRQSFAAINDDLFVIGNGISTYSEQISPDHNLGVVPHTDGMLGEHYGAFEEVINAENGKINVTDLLFWSVCISGRPVSG